MEKSDNVFQTNTEELFFIIKLKDKGFVRIAVEPGTLPIYSECYWNEDDLLILLENNFDLSDIENIYETE